MGAKVAYRDIAAQIRSQILTGSLQVGDRLPAEADLSDRFSVGRSTIREALRLLSSQHLIVTTRGTRGGSIVTQVEHNDATDMLRDFIQMLAMSDRTTVAELLEARDLLEVPAARLAATRGSHTQLETLRATIPESLEEVDVGHIYDVNRAFHETLLDMAGNRLLRVVTLPLFIVMESWFLRDRATKGFWQQVIAEHAAILAAVEAGDGGRAAAEMSEHLLHLRATYESIDRRRLGGRDR